MKTSKAKVEKPDAIFSVLTPTSMDAFNKGQPGTNRSSQNAIVLHFELGLIHSHACLYIVVLLSTQDFVNIRARTRKRPKESDVIFCKCRFMRELYNKHKSPTPGRLYSP